MKIYALLALTLLVSIAGASAATAKAQYNFTSNCNDFYGIYNLTANSMNYSSSTFLSSNPPSSASFNGTNGSNYCTGTTPINSAALRTTGENFTIIMWVWFNNETPPLNKGTIWSTDMGATSASIAHLNNSGQTRTIRAMTYEGVNNPQLTYQFPTGNIVGAWKQIAWVRNGSNHYLYVNGTQVNSSTYTIGGSSTGQTNIIGRTYGPSDSFNTGFVDLLYMENNSWNAAQINASYSGNLTIIPATTNNLSITAINNYTGSTITTFNASVQWNGTTTTYTTTTNQINTTAGVNNTLPANITITANGLYFIYSTTNYNTTTLVASIIPWANITANSNNTRSMLTTFNATYNSTVYTTNTGSVQIPAQGTYNIIINAAQHFSTNGNGTANTTLNQSVTPWMKIKAYELYAPTTQLLGITVTHNGTTYTNDSNSSVYVPVLTTGQITVSLSGYYSNTTNITSTNQEKNVTLVPNYKNVQIKSELTNASIMATCTWNGETGTSNNFTIILEGATNNVLYCEREYYAPKNTTLTLNSTLNETIYLTPYKLQLTFSSTVRGVLGDILNETERQTLTFNSTSVIQTTESLADGIVKVAFSCVGSSFLFSYCTNPLGNFSQFYEYINTGDPQTDTVYVQNSLELPLWIRTNDRGGRPIKDVQVQLLTWNTTGNFTSGQQYNYLLIGQRITDNEGYTYFNVNGGFGNVIRIIASSEGFGTTYYNNLQVADVAPNSKGEPLNLVLDNSQTSYTGGTTFYSNKITNTTSGETTEGFVYDRQATSVSYTTTYRETYCNTTNSIILAQCGGAVSKELSENSVLEGMYAFTITSGVDYNSSTTNNRECITFLINEEDSYEYCITINEIAIAREIAEPISDEEATPLIKTAALLALIILSAAIGIGLQRTTAGFTTFMIGSLLLSAIIPAFMLLGIISAYYYAIKLVGKTQQG